MASAAIIHVDGNKATNGDGQFWNTAYNNLKSALDAAVAEDQIWVRGSSSGITYKPGAARADTFALKSRVKIYGGFAGTETPTQFALRDPVANLTILSGDIGTADDPSDNCYHVVTATGALEFPSTVLDGFTIKRGNTIPDGRNDPPANYSGAGILVSGDGQTCEPIIARCVFVENEVDANGGGAAVAGSASHPWFVNCEFRENHATSSGGGLAVGGATATMMNCVVHHNTAGTSGGGAFVSGINSTLYVRSSTFAENDAGATGGLAKGNNNGLADVTNSIFWGNTDSNPTAHDQVSSITANYCCIQELPTGLGDNNIGADPVDDNPLFLNAAGGDFRLALNSPCIDVGLTAALPPDVANIDADGGVDALSEATPLDFGLGRRVSLKQIATTDLCDPSVLDMGAYENGDCDGDGTRDEDEVDSNNDGIPDDCQDCNGNSVLDTDEIAGNDCNENGRLDECDIELGCSLDANGNGIPDDCECPIDVLFLVDSSGSMSSGSGGGGAPGDDGELGEVCTMLDQIEEFFVNDPAFRFTRLTPSGSGQCMTLDLVAYGLPDDEPSNSCGGTIDEHAMMSSIEVVSIGMPDGAITPPPPPLWRDDAIRVIVSITDEGSTCNENCSPSHTSVTSAIAAANNESCFVFAISGVFGGDPPECAEVLANAVVAGTTARDQAWHPAVEADFLKVGGIRDDLIAALQRVARECLFCVGDIDLDSTVGSSDLAILLGAWGECDGCLEDLDLDGDVDSGDLAILLGAWGPCTPGVPAPNESMGESSMQSSELFGESVVTPDQLADLLGFADVGELATYLGSLDFEAMQDLLEAFLGG